MAGWQELLQAGHARGREGEGERATRLVAALLGEGWPCTLPLCLAAAAAREMGRAVVEVPFLGLVRAEARWAAVVGAALQAAGLGRAVLRPWGLELPVREGAWRLLPWGWVEEHTWMVACRSLQGGWQLRRGREGEGPAGSGWLSLARQGEEVRLLWGPPGRAALGAETLRGTGAVVSPLPWLERPERAVPVLSPRQLGPWLERALSAWTR